MGFYNDLDMFITKVKKVIQRTWPAILTLTIIFYGLLAWQTGDSLITRAIGSIGLFIVTAWAAYEAFSLTREIENDYTKRAWQYIGVGLMLWTVAQAFEGFIEIILLRQRNVPSLIDLIRLAGAMAFIVAFSSLPSSLYGGFGRIRDILDISLLVTGSLTLFWLIFFRSILLIGFAEPIPAFWAQIHGALGLILISLVLYRVFQSSRMREIFSYLTFGAGVLLISVSSIVQGYQSLGEPTSQFGWVETGTIMGTSFIIYASNTFRGKMIGFWRRGEVREFRQPKWRIDVFLPIAFAYGVIGFLILDWWVAGEVDQFALQGAILMAVLLIARQGAILGQSELRKYAELVNATADMAFICDRQGKIILDNPSLREAIGTSSHKDSVPGLSEIMTSTLSLDALLSIASVSGWVGEVNFKRMDGSTFPASLSLIPIEDERHGKDHFAATAHDLTMVKQRENDLKKALDELADAQEDLQSLNVELEGKVEARTQELTEMVSHLAKLNEELNALDEMKTEFVALVSHELRAPLTNIRSGLEVVLETVGDLDNETQESLSLIMAETERLGGFVETILDLSALEAGRFPIHLRSLSLPEIVEDVCSKFSLQAGGERIKYNLAHNLPLIVADDRGVHSILYHLLDNAIKYAPEGEIHLNAIAQDEQVILSICDSGPGIPEPERENVFEMFYRLDSSDSREIYGRGLGLNLARRFLDVMGGGIEITDSESGGTEVRFWLPAETEPI